MRGWGGGRRKAEQHEEAIHYECGLPWQQHQREETADNGVRAVCPDAASIYPPTRSEMRMARPRWADDEPEAVYLDGKPDHLEDYDPYEEHYKSA